MSKYRSIWIKHHGPIPKDCMGRPYDIHHIDGNRQNNSINNLIAIPIHIHYAIHYEQKDWMAAHALSLRMQMSEEDRSDIIKKMSESKKGKKHTEESKKKCARPGHLNGMYNKKHSKETIELMKKNRKGKGTGRKNQIYKNNFKPMFGDKNPASRTVSQYDLLGKLIATYKTIEEARSVTGANNISAVCRGKLKKSGNYIWKYN
jgi:hypothetical protein